MQSRGKDPEDTAVEDKHEQLLSDGDDRSDVPGRDETGGEAGLVRTSILGTS